MFYTKHAPSDSGGDFTVYAGRHIDRTNIFFTGLTGKGGRIVHLINGFRFVCGRKFAVAPHILSDSKFAIDARGEAEGYKYADGLRVCNRCYVGMKRVSVDEKDIKIDTVKLSQMHFKIILEAVANSILLASNKFDGTSNGMAISEPEHHEEARALAGDVVLNSFKLKGKRGAQSFRINTMFTRVLNFVPGSTLQIFAVAPSMMRHGQMAIVRPPKAGMPHLMLIVNSSIMYYTACKIKQVKSEDEYGGETYEVTPLPYEAIDYNQY